MQNIVRYLKYSRSFSGLSPGDNDNTYGQELIIRSGTHWTGLLDPDLTRLELSACEKRVDLKPKIMLSYLILLFCVVREKTDKFLTTVKSVNTRSFT